MRPRTVWIIFGLSFTVLLAAMGWVSFTAVQLEAEQARIQIRADHEERLRLALWRIDSALTPLIQRESSWPYFAYSAFYPAERAYTRMFNETQPDEILLPSPLLTLNSTNTLLHFQYHPDRRLTSPQVPDNRPDNPAIKYYLSQKQIQSASNQLERLHSLLEFDRLLATCAAPPSPPSSVQPPLQEPDPGGPGIEDFAQNVAQTLAPQITLPAAQQQQIQQQELLNFNESVARAKTYQQASQRAEMAAPDSRRNVSEGTVRPAWFSDALILARRVTVDQADYIQGCWLNWTGLRQWLLASVHDLLPNARLEPAPGLPGRPGGNLLASLPVRLIPGTPPQTVSRSPFTPIRYALLIAWLSLLLAGGAVALLLHAAVSLSERRAAFVSAVTHELRTPLTTFKMYSEMLANGMVSGARQRRQYLETLRGESNRLGHLVENVLAYARLERGSARRQLQEVALAELIEHVQPRLRQRCEQAGLGLAVNASHNTLQQRFPADITAVEQILFNLVDNACKYAAPHSTEPLLNLDATIDSHSVRLTVRDRGLGIAPADQKNLFRPFNKSAQKAAHSAPGVGLGLALCRRLSRELGGSLQLNPTSSGASFTLTLPRAR